jgi:glycerate 2-kinase
VGSVTIDRALCEDAFRDAVRACNPTHLVHAALARAPVQPPYIGLAVGKAAQAMARGVTGVTRGLCITNTSDGHPLPQHWRRVLASHPLPDESSIAAGMNALALVESANDGETLLALISGGASSLMELPARGVTLDQIRRRTAETIASGAPIHELNRVRAELSALKDGKLADRALGPVVTLVISDVSGDDPSVIGSGPTVRDGDRVEVIAAMALFGERVQAALAGRGLTATRHAAPLTGDVLDVAAALASERGPLVAWGEPTVKLPAIPGEGGRATQLALALAKHLRGSDRSAFVAASDGKDASTPAAGAYVNGDTWDRIADGDVELARCNALHALTSIDAVFTSGPTGINHADVVVIG